MSKKTRLLGMAIVALLILGFMSSCSEEQIQTESATTEEAYLNLSFSTAAASTTRADESSSLDKDETAANPGTESDIHSIKVWVFKSDSGNDATPIAYKEDAPSTVANGSYKLSLMFLRKYNGEEVKNIDLYILANSEATNASINNWTSVTRKDLQNLTFSSPFGITSEGKAETTSVPEKGLPISRAIKNIDVERYVADTQEGASSKAISIPLVRAISKLHFYFARKANANTGDVKVTKIEVDGNIFPTENFIFPDEEDYSKADANKAATSQKYSTLNKYDSSTLTLDGVENSGIKEVENPESYKRGENEAAQTYMDKLNKDIQSHDLCYLRETNKTITGKIYYKTDAKTEKSVKFSIPASGNAIRNRELVVYGYFLEGGALYVNPIVEDWKDGGTYTYTDAVSIKTNIEVTEGHGANIQYQNATYGPKITFSEISTGNKSWVLQTDSPDYGFIYATDVNSDGSYDLSKVMTVIKGTSTTTKVDDFYVVPTSELDYTKRNNYDCKVWMIAYSPNQKVIINAPQSGSGTATGTGTQTEMVFTQTK